MNLSPTRINDLPVQIYSLDNEGLIVEANDALVYAFGFKSQKAILGMAFSSFLPLNIAAIIQNNNQKVLAARETLTFTEPFHYSNGFEALLISKKIPLFNAKKEVVGIRVVSLDCTAEKKQEEARRKMLDSVIGLMPGHVYWKNARGEFLGCNEAQAETAGLAREEMIGKTDWEMPWKALAVHLRQNDLEVMRTRESLTIDEELIVKGELREFLSKKVPLVDSENNVCGILGVSFDITDQRRIEELKLQTRIANERADSMRLMASSIAHELRTPLSAIHSAMGWMHEELPKLLKIYEIAKEAELPIPSIHPRRVSLMNRVCQDVSYEAESANNIINMLLMKLGQVNLPVENFDYCSIKSTVTMALTRYPFSSEEHRRLVHWNPKTDFQFKGSELLLSHVLFNLLKNAIHFIEEAGKGEIFIELRKENIQNRLIFRDTGKGISPKDLPSIFEKFFSKTLHGNGIGLAFCQQVMHSFGGTIECRSEEGEFAEFILGFPKLRKEDANAIKNS
jgi:PAS domain S-box-containing protein